MKHACRQQILISNLLLRNNENIKVAQAPSILFGGVFAFLSLTDIKYWIMERVKMVVTDMDGTLLDSQKRLPSEFVRVYNGLKEKGIHFVVASGRQFYTLENEFKDMDHEIFFIAENGGVIVCDGEMNLLKPIKTSNVEKLIKHVRNIEGAELVLCGKESAYVESKSEEFVSETMKYYHRCIVVDDLLEVQDEILKVAVNDMHNLETTTLESVQVFSEDFHISTSSQIWLDVMPKGVNKGEAVRYLQNKLGVSMEDTMGFGDYLNDYEMLQSVGYSYAMANAHEDVKRVAKYITKTNDENGVVEILDQLLLV